MQNIIKKDKSLPAILNGVRQAVANAENQPKTKQEIRNEKITRRREAAQRLVNSGMLQKDVAKVLGVSYETVKADTFVPEDIARLHSKESMLKAHAMHMAAFKERKAYYVPIMLELRKHGYTNAEIAEKTGFSYLTVLRYIGDQPDELTLMSMRVVGAKRRLRNKAIVNNIAREQAEQSKIIPIAGD